MSDLGTTVGLIKALAPKPDPEEIKQDVEDWLDDHPEATTTVQDGSITKAKLDSNLKGTVDDVDALKSALNDLVETTSFVYGSITDQGADNVNPVYTRARTPMIELTQNAWVSCKTGEKYILFQYASDGTFEVKITSTWVNYPIRLDKSKKYRLMASFSDDSSLIGYLDKLGADFIISYTGTIEEEFKRLNDNYNYIYNHPVANNGTDPNGFDADNLTTSQVYSAYDALVALLPNNAKKTVIGTDQSENFEVRKYEFFQPGTTIYNSNGVAVNSIPNMPINLIITSGTHGNGTGGDNTDSIISLYEFIRDVYTSTEYSEVFEWIKNNIHFIIIPVVNPWGIDNKSRYNSRGVDINRNFPYGWTSQEHTGASAASELETQNIIDVFDENSIAHLFIEVHTRGGSTQEESLPVFLTQCRQDCPTQYGMQSIQGYLARYFNNAPSAIHQDPQNGGIPGTSWKTYGIPSVLIECAHNPDNAGKHSKLCDKMNTSMVGNTIYRLSQFVVDNARQIIDAKST